MGFLSILAWAIFLGATALSIALGGILGFHWKQYSVTKETFYLAFATYAIGCLVLLMLLLGSVTSFT